MKLSTLLFAARAILALGCFVFALFLFQYIARCISVIVHCSRSYYKFNQVTKSNHIDKEFPNYGSRKMTPILEFALEIIT